MKVSPDGNSVVIETDRADWNQQIFRKELWLYRVAIGTLLQLTQSGRESSPQWSPDGQWIAFLSERKSGTPKTETPETAKPEMRQQSDANKDGDKDKDVAQLYLISPNGGEAFAVTSGDEEVHAFAWSADSRAILFATREPWNKQQNDDHKKEWKDVIRYRGDERGDVIFRISLEDALARHAALGSKEITDAEKDSGLTPGAVSHYAHAAARRLKSASRTTARRLAFVTSSVSERQEKVEDIELYLVNLISANAAESAPIRLTHNEAVELNLEWAPDSRHLFFQINLGSVERQVRGSAAAALLGRRRTPARTQSNAGSPIIPARSSQYAALPMAPCSARAAWEPRFSSIRKRVPQRAIVKRDGWAGTYETPASAWRRRRASPSPTRRPSSQPKSISPTAPTNSRRRGRSHRSTSSSPNAIFRKAKPYRWTSD